MQGYVRQFRPTKGAGTIVTDSGEVVPFTTGDMKLDLRGGDVVRFQVSDSTAARQSATPHLCRLELIRSGIDDLTPTQRSEIEELFHAIEWQNAAY